LIGNSRPSDVMAYEVTISDARCVDARIIRTPYCVEVKLKGILLQTLPSTVS